MKAKQITIRSIALVGITMLIATAVVSYLENGAFSSVPKFLISPISLLILFTCTKRQDILSLDPLAGISIPMQLLIITYRPRLRKLRKLRRLHIFILAGEP